MIELRKLQSTDLFTMVSILNKIGIQEIKNIMTPEKMNEFVKTFKSDTKESSDQKESDDEKLDMTTVLGMNVILDIGTLVLGNLPKCEVEVATLLSNLSGIKVKDIQKLDIVEYTQMIVDVFKKDEFKDFIKVVLGLFK